MEPERAPEILRQYGYHRHLYAGKNESVWRVVLGKRLHSDRGGQPEREVGQSRHPQFKQREKLLSPAQRFALKHQPGELASHSFAPAFPTLPLRPHPTRVFRHYFREPCCLGHKTYSLPRKPQGPAELEVLVQSESAPRLARKP